MIGGKTRLCGIFGCPVEHSLSPALHNAAFEQMSLDWAYVPFLVKPEDLSGAIGAVRALNLAGVNVTVPHKQAVIEFVDELSPEARLSGAVNTLVNSGGVLTGHNTDGEGFIRAIREEAGKEYALGPSLIIGAGGAARAVAVALALNGAPEIIVANRSEESARKLCGLLKKKTGCEASFLRLTGRPGEKSPEYMKWADVLGRVNLVVQTTSLGMHPEEEKAPPIPFELLNHSHAVVDIIYHPVLTRFLKECRAAGARVINGLGMLLHQGAIAFELWTGCKPPLDVMRGAIEKSIREKVCEK